MAVIRDTLNLSHQWRDAGLEPEKADKMVTALSAELQTGDTATKQDLTELKASLLQWIATLLIAQVGVLFALLKLFD